MTPNWKSLETEVVHCDRCKRLRKHCLDIAKTKRKSYASETYWGRPVPSFGDHDARLVIIGLAPAAHGANRTGRLFTGDRSGDWLYRALHKAGFANQATSTHKDDGLKLKDVFITATVKCAPPDNKPAPDEITRCLDYLRWELDHLKKARVYLALGKLAFDQTWNILKQTGDGGAKARRPDFGHNHEAQLTSGRWILASYHPSQQNTFTGKLSEPMFDAVFSRAKKLI